MIDTIIVSGGKLDRDFALDFLKKVKEQTKGERLMLAAADKGLEFFMEHHIQPDLAVGDFDSLSREGKEYLDRLPADKVCRLKPEKDDSDTQSAVCLAIKQGAKEIAILGATGTRLDHIMANLGLLTLADELGAHLILLDPHNYITLIKSPAVLEKEKQFGRYVSFFPLGSDVQGLTLTGFKYPLKNRHLTVVDSGLTVSNEILEPKATVSFTCGRLLMIMSRD